MEEEEKKEQQETHTEKKTKCLHCSPWTSIASVPHKASTIWTLTFTVSWIITNTCMPYTRFSGPSDLLLWSVLWDSRQTERREGHIRTSLALASSLPITLEQHFAKVTGLWNAADFLRLLLCKVSVTSEKISQTPVHYNNRHGSSHCQN